MVANAMKHCHFTSAWHATADNRGHQRRQRMVVSQASQPSRQLSLSPFLPD